MTREEFMTALRACCAATLEQVKKETKTAADAEAKAYRKFFTLAIGRKPTAEEVAFMTAMSNELPPEETPY